MNHIFFTYTSLLSQLTWGGRGGVPHSLLTTTERARLGTFRGFNTERARLGTLRGFGTERARLGTFKGFGTERARLDTFRGFGTERLRLWAQNVQD